MPPTNRTWTPPACCRWPRLSPRRKCAAYGPRALYAEEFDIEQRRLRGNPPQAFVHALLLESAIRLAK
ncbi:hypothetical protein ACTWQF_07870 [Streptomyces sp. 8N114]|uniref:hypothetical protein n=1 Tax=Streptomyces sp. 8N114 TaxID=3457419 RepID=UPI003FD16F5B